MAILFMLIYDAFSQIHSFVFHTVIASHHRSRPCSSPDRHLMISPPPPPIRRQAAVAWTLLEPHSNKNARVRHYCIVSVDAHRLACLVMTFSPAALHQHARYISQLLHQQRQTNER